MGAILGGRENRGLANEGRAKSAAESFYTHDEAVCQPDFPWMTASSSRWGQASVARGFMDFFRSLKFEMQMRLARLNEHVLRCPKLGELAENSCIWEKTRRDLCRSGDIKDSPSQFALSAVIWIFRTDNDVPKAVLHPRNMPAVVKTSLQTFRPYEFVIPQSLGLHISMT